MLQSFQKQCVALSTICSPLEIIEEDFAKSYLTNTPLIKTVEVELEKKCNHASYFCKISNILK